VQADVEVAAIGVGGVVQLRLQRLQAQVHALQRIELLPVEGAGLQAQRGAQRLLPAEAAGQLQRRPGAVAQAQALDLRAAGIGAAVQTQRDRPVAPGQPATALDGEALLQVAARLQGQLRQAQGRWQAGGGEEVAGLKVQRQRQAVLQRCQPAAEVSVQIAAAARLQLQTLAQTAIQLHGQLPGTAIHVRQAQPGAGAQRPVAVGLQVQIVDAQLQIVAGQLHGGQAQAAALQLRAEGQFAQLLGSIDAQAAQRQMADPYFQRQADLRQLQRRAGRVRGGRQVERQLGGMQFVQTQAALQQAAQTQRGTGLRDVQRGAAVRPVQAPG